MGKDLNKELKTSKDLLKDMRDETGLLYDALTSIGTNIADSITELIDGATELDDIGRTIANTYGKEIESSLKKSAKGLERNIKLQIKINSGKNASKDIERAIGENLARKQTTLMHIESLHKNVGKLTKDQEHLQAKLTNEAINTFKANETLLGSLSDQNIEKQRGISLYKLASDAFGDFANKIDKSGTLSKILAGNFKEVYSTARLGQLTVMSLVSFVGKGISELDKLQTQYNKSFGMTDAQAMSLQSNMSRIADESGRTSITFRDMHKVMEGIGEATGILAAGLRDDVIEEAAEMQKLLGMSNKGMAMLAFNAQVTGQNMEAQSQSMVRGVQAAEKDLGITIDKRKVLQEVGELSGLIRANFGRNVGLMSEVVAKAKAFGLTMQDLASISSNLLNFQSSIEAELTAELFTGKQLNLEKARLYALTGDYKGLMGEIVGQMGSEYEYLQMNVIAKEKYAAALGMSVNQMSDLIFKEGDLAAIKEQATLNNDQDTLNMLKQRDLTEKMADIMTKIQTTFITIAEGPIGTLASLMSGLLESTTLLYTMLGMLAGIKLLGLISSMMALAAASKSAAVAGMAAKFAANPVAGLVIALGVGAIAGIVGSSIDKESAKPPKVGSFQNLPKGKMVSVDQGEARIHKGEFVGHMSDFADWGKKIVEAIMGQKLIAKVNVQSHHGTKYV